MSTLNELAEQVDRLYPLKDTHRGIRYRIVNQLAGTTELEAVNGQPRYVPTLSLRDRTLWKLSA